MGWFKKLFGIHEFSVTCHIQTDNDKFFESTFPVSVPKSLYSITDESVIESAVKNVLFVKIGIVVKDIKIIEFHEI